MTWREYLLVCLMEECSEIQHITAKSLRFGIHDSKPRTDKVNYDELVAEVNDFMAVLDMLEEAGIVIPISEERKSKKIYKVLRYAQRSVNNGVLPCLPK